MILTANRGKNTRIQFFFEKPENLYQMKSKSYTAMGALHPILFFAVMYVVVLFLSIFICSSIFNSLNGTEASLDLERKQEMTARKSGLPIQVSSAVVLR